MTAGGTAAKDAAAILLSSRPVSWINTAFPFAVAYLLTTRELDATAVVGTLYFLVPYNLAMYGINDVFDYASDLANPRKGGIEGALLGPSLHRRTIWTAVCLNIPFLVWLYAVGDAASWIALSVSLFAVIAYSAPRLRFKERPFVDSATSSVHFVSPAVVGLTLSGAAPTTGTILVLVSFFLWGMASHAFGAVQDIRPDRDAGIASIATAIGARATVRFSIALWTASGLVVLAAPWPAPLGAVLAIPYLLNALPWWNVEDADAASTNRAWRRFIALNYFAGFLATMIVILAWLS